MSSSLRLGKLFGIPFGINYSWFIIFAIVTASLALGYFPSEYRHWSPLQSWVVGIATSLLFFASVVAHELAHSIVSIAFGIPVKSITLFLFGGVSQISREAARPRSELIMAAAGPATSLAIAAFFGAISFITSGFSEHLSALAAWLGIINVALALFNMVPGFPLDGGRVLRAILWGMTGNYKRATRIASLSGQGVAYLLIFAGVYLMLRGNLPNGLWLMLIGWFLENAASASYRQVELREALQGYKAAELMTQDCPSVPRDLTLGDLVRRHIFLTGRRCFLVSGDGRLEGMVTLREVKKVPQERWDTMTVAQAMLPAEKLHVARYDEDALTILERMDEEDINQMPVTKDGEVVGMIGRDNLLRFIRTRSELRM